MGLDPGLVMVIEDSHIGLTAAKAAGMNCLVRSVERTPLATPPPPSSPPRFSGVRCSLRG